MYSVNLKNTNIEIDSSRKHICYEFGLSTNNTVFITESDSICNVLIIDKNGQCFSSTCKITPLLKWAFNEMTYDTPAITVTPDNEYKFYFYQLSIINDSCQIIASSIAQENYNKDVKAKIEELKSFMIKLWYSNYIDEM